MADIAVTATILGGHTHITVRTGTRPGSRALSGRLVMDNLDAQTFMGVLEAADPARGIICEWTD